MRVQLTKITLAATLALAITFTILSCGDSNNPGGGGGKPTTGNAQKDACIREMAADKSNTPQGIADECGVTQEDIWNLVVNGPSFGTCDSEQLVQYLGNSLSEIEQACGAEIPKLSSSSGNGSSSSVALRECVGTPGQSKFCYDGTFYDKCDGLEYDPATHYCSECGQSYPNSKCDNSCTGINSICEAQGIMHCRTNSSFCQNGLGVGGILYEAKCNGTQYNPLNQRCQNNVVETKCGSGFYDPAKQFCYRYNYSDYVINKCGGSVAYNPETEVCLNGVKKSYEASAVNIGGQIWMSMNYNNPFEYGSSCYNNSEANCDKYGRLYITGHDVCPAGWHLPTMAEWSALSDFIESDKKCTNCVYSHLGAASLNSGLDSYGFAALLGGVRGSSYSSLGSDGCFSIANDRSGWLIFRSGYAGFARAYDPYGDIRYVSVRCLKNGSVSQAPRYCRYKQTGYSNYTCVAALENRVCPEVKAYDLDAGIYSKGSCCTGTGGTCSTSTSSMNDFIEDRKLHCAYNSPTMICVPAPESVTATGQGEIDKCPKNSSYNQCAGVGPKADCIEFGYTIMSALP